MGFKPHSIDLDELLDWAASELQRPRLDDYDRAELIAALTKRAVLMRSVIDQVKKPLAIAGTILEGLVDLVEGREP